MATDKGRKTVWSLPRMDESNRRPWELVQRVLHTLSTLFSPLENDLEEGLANPLANLSGTSGSFLCLQVIPKAKPGFLWSLHQLLLQWALSGRGRVKLLQAGAYKGKESGLHRGLSWWKDPQCGLSHSSRFPTGWKVTAEKLRHQISDPQISFSKKSSQQKY